MVSSTDAKPTEESVRLYVNTGVLPDASWPKAKVRAYERGLIHAKLSLEGTGGTLSLHRVSETLGISRWAVARKIKSGSLFAVPGPSGRRRCPAIQFTSTGSIVPGIKDVIAAIGPCHPHTLLWFLATPIDLLNYKRAVDLMQTGEISPVLRAARGLFEQGA